VNTAPKSLAKAGSIAVAVAICGYLIWTAQLSAQSPGPSPSDIGPSPTLSDTAGALEGDATAPQTDASVPPILMQSSKMGIVPPPTPQRLKRDPRPPALLHSTKVLILDQDTSDEVLAPGQKTSSNPSKNATLRPTSQPIKQSRTPSTQPVQSPSPPSPPSVNDE